MEGFNKAPVTRSIETLSQEKEFSENFLNRYENEGMQVSKNDSLHSDDDSLLFSNSTMFRFKETIKNQQIPESGIAAQQLCLRTPDLSLYEKEGYQFNHPSLFNMVGLLLPKKATNAIFSETYKWLENVGVDRERIYVKTTKNELIANSSLPDDLPRIIIDTENPSFYKWDYGTEGLYGEGITFSILQNDGSILDVGNVIAFIDDKRNLVGWETAFGIETLTARRDNMPLYKKHLMFEIFGEITDEQQKPLLDSLGSVSELIAQGFRPGSKKQEYIVRKYLNIIDRLSKRLSINIDPLVTKYCELRDQDGQDILGKMKMYILQLEMRRKENFVKFTRYLSKNQNLTLAEKVAVAKSSFSLNKEDIENLV